MASAGEKRRRQSLPPDVLDDMRYSGLADTQRRVRLLTEATNMSADGTRSISQSQPYSQSSGHVFGPLSADGSATVQQGDAYHNYGPESHIHGQSVVAGNMTVYNTNCHQVHSSGGPDAHSNASLELRKALYYTTMDTRKAQIDHRSSASFEWVWTETCFPAWLRSQRGIFWINGKPASGKSTLIANLVSWGKDYEKVEAHLQELHPSYRVVHFFFNFRAGVAIANTPVGMLRSLLLQLIETSPIVEQHILKKYGHRSGGEWPELESELLEMICDSIKSQSLFVCGFLDGLDEYEGSLLRLVDVILVLQTRSGMKLCLASRPETQITHKLGGVESFSMQQHNTGTMEAYAERAFSGLSLYLSEQELSAITDRVSRDANGVILWARFAIDEVVCAILAGSGLYDLVRLLDAFPSELEAIYRRIWSQLGNPQKLQAATILFLIESWNTHRQGFDLLLEDLLLLCSRVLQDLSWNDVVAPYRDHDLNRFRLKIHSLVRGLVELIPKCGLENLDIFGPEMVHKFIPSLVHKTLRAFLQADKDYQSISHRIRKLADWEEILATYHATNICAASEALRPDSEYELPRLSWSSHKTYAMSLPNRTSGPVLPSLRSIDMAIRALCTNTTLDRPEYTELLLNTCRTWLFQRFMREQLNYDRSFVGKFSMPCSIPYKHPELLFFVEHGYLNVFSAVIQEAGWLSNADDRSLLFAAMLSSIYLHAWEGMNYGTKLQRLRNSAWAVVLFLLNGLRQDAHFLSLCIAPDVHFQAISDLIPESCGHEKLCRVRIHPSIWWQHEDSHLLLVWVASPFATRSKCLQKQRLAKLLNSGISLMDDINKVGHVMDALFQPWLWKEDFFLPPFPSELTTDEGYRRPHFSLEKFDVLLEAGFELDHLGWMKQLKAAERLLAYFSKICGRFTISAKQVYKDEDIEVDDEVEDDASHSNADVESMVDFYEIILRQKLEDYEALVNDLEADVIPFLELKTQKSDQQAGTST